MGVIDRVGPNVKNLKIGDVRPFSASSSTSTPFPRDPDPFTSPFCFILYLASRRILPDRVRHAPTPSLAFAKSAPLVSTSELIPTPPIALLRLRCGTCEFCKKKLSSFCERTNNSALMKTMYGQRDAGFFGCTHKDHSSDASREWKQDEADFLPPRSHRLSLHRRIPRRTGRVR